jgi:hypothetical protein
MRPNNTNPQHTSLQLSLILLTTSHLSHYPHDPTPLKSLCTDLHNPRHITASSERHITSHHITPHHAHPLQPTRPSYPRHQNPQTQIHTSISPPSNTHTPTYPAPLPSSTLHKQEPRTTSAEPIRPDKLLCVRTCTGRTDRSWCRSTNCEKSECSIVEACIGICAR